MGAALLTPLGAAACSGSGGGRKPRLLKSRLPLPQPFLVPLPVPPVLKPARSDAGADYYDMTLRAAPAEILPGRKTLVWGYEGRFPGPTIEARAGRRAVVRQRNELPVPVVTHLHGGVTPPASDGYPTDLLLPADGSWQEHMHDTRASVARVTRQYDYPHAQRAATLWYHDHRMDFTGAQVWRGLAGFHIVRDETEDALPLPKGERDIPLMICDRSFDADGSLLYPSVDRNLRSVAGVKDGYGGGVLGDVILVNGAPWPVLEVTATAYRFRILNASNAREYKLVLDPPPPGGRGIQQIGSDGGLLAAPVAHDALEIVPGERFDVVVDFSRYRVGSVITLRNRNGSGATGAVMRFQVTRAARGDGLLPAKLAEVERLDPAAAAVTRKFSFRSGMIDGHSGWTINGHAFDPARTEARPRLGAVERWQLTSDLNHPVHLHLAGFQVVSRGDGKPGAYDAGWKDTVALHSNETVTILARFTGYQGRYVMHCHNLEHEDMAMMANFEVV